VNSPDIGAMEKAMTVPVLSADADIHVVENTAINPLAIIDTEPNKALKWTVSGDVPSGVTASEDANGMTYNFSGAPTVWGDYSFSVTASNEKGNDTVNVSVTVYTAPVLSDEVEIKAVKGTAMTQTLPAISGNHLVWTLNGDVPAGLEVSSDDTSVTLSGTPTTAGDYSFTFTASNMAGSDDMTVSMIIYELPVLSGGFTLDTVKDTAIVEQTITATSGNHIEWSVDGTVPSGMYVYNTDTALTVSGTPTVAGDYSFTVTASNYAGSDDAKVEVTVYEAPTLSGSSMTIQAVEGQALTGESVTVNSGNHLRWTRAGTFPNGLRITSGDSSFAITGTPSAGSAGSYDCTFTASNFAGNASLRVKTTVYTVPAFSETSATIDAMEKTAITSKTITAASGNYLTWSTTGSLPSGISVSSNDTSVTLSGTPSEGTRGSYTYSISTTNHAGSATSTITLNVITDDFEITSKDVSSATTLSDFLATLSANQLSAIKKLKLNEYITDLSGIDALINLEALDLTEATALSTVSLVSNDTILSLDIHGNASITELNVKASALVYVNAESCANLSLVNAENCANLETLLCKSCAVNELYLSGCADLMTLDFTGNAIRKFNARGFTVLADFEGVGQILSVDVLGRSFDFGSFLNLAKVSVVEPSVTSTDIENVKNVKGYDNDGDEVSCNYDNATGIALFDTVPYKVEYNYMATDDVSIDVTIWGEPDLSAPSLSSSDVRISAT
ncbi:MAG: hypothetical protein IJL10_01010, partial [Synergistaceae bacterium]|nr:hypothetical protein [Synergistaceae bacterium]